MKKIIRLGGIFVKKTKEWIFAHRSDENGWFELTEENHPNLGKIIIENRKHIVIGLGIVHTPIRVWKKEEVRLITSITTYA